MVDKPYRSPHRFTPPDQETQALILKATREAWGCPRGDKFHYLTPDAAEVGRQAAIRENPTHEACEVYQCPCGGWVYGRPWHLKHPTTDQENRRAQ